MQMRKITNADLHGRGVRGQPDTPNLSRDEMQRAVEEIAREVIIPAFNENAENVDNFKGTVDDFKETVSEFKENTVNELDKKANRSELEAETAARIAEGNVLRGKIDAHAEEDERHVSPQDRTNWNGKVDRAELEGKASAAEVEAIRNNTVRIATSGGGFIAGRSMSAPVNATGVAIGNTTVINEGGIAIGAMCRALNGESIAIGNRANAVLPLTIQLGQGENSAPETLQVYRYRLMNADGTIPDARIPQIGQISAALTAILGV